MSSTIINFARQVDKHTAHPAAIKAERFAACQNPEEFLAAVNLIKKIARNQKFPPRYKTQLCKNKACLAGFGCRFAHTEAARYAFNSLQNPYFKRKPCSSCHDVNICSFVHPGELQLHANGSLSIYQPRSKSAGQPVAPRKPQIISRPASQPVRPQTPLELLAELEAGSTELPRPEDRLTKELRSLSEAK